MEKPPSSTPPPPLGIPSPDAPELVGFRHYLLLLARVQLDPRRAKDVDASDIVQQTMLEAHRNWDQFRGQTSGERAAWMRRILAHNLADALRAMGREKRDAGRLVSLEQELERSSIRLADLLAADQSSPSHGGHRQERALRLAAALAELPEAQREALMLQYWQGWPLARISEHLGRSTDAVAGLLKRGLKQLRTTLHPNARRGPNQAT
jgi:RNA polymerase sigma-70 factor (ECF subfamily)